MGQGIGFLLGPTQAQLDVFCPAVNYRKCMYVYVCVSVYVIVCVWQPLKCN